MPISAYGLRSINIVKDISETKAAVLPSKETPKIVTTTLTFSMILNSRGSYSLEPTARAKYFYFFNSMNTGGKNVVSILDIHLPELEL